MIVGRGIANWPLIVGLLISPLTSLAQEIVEEQPFRAGLIARYADAANHLITRLDESVGFDWRETGPDPRLAGDMFSVHWRGRLAPQSAGAHKIHLFAAGNVSVQLAGKEIIPAQDVPGAWLSSADVDLDGDAVPMEITFRRTGTDARIFLAWSGPQFPLEPIGAPRLVHDRAQTVDLKYERGELLAASLRCTACHFDQQRLASRDAPSLARLGGNLQREWVVEHLAHNQPSPLASRKMPNFSLTRDEADAVTAYLMQAPAAPPPNPAVVDAVASVKTGERLFLTLGCLACHQLGKLGESGLFGGGDLSHIADKRPADFFARWLADPGQLNPNHNMPVFDLSPAQRRSLAMFLAEQKSPAVKQAEKNGPAPTALAEQIEAGRKLAVTHRCGACHALPREDRANPPVVLAGLHAGSDWAKSCAGALTASKAGIGYDLPRADLAALRDFFAAQLATKASIEGRTLLIQHNCLACHPREGFTSLAALRVQPLAEKLAAVVDAHRELAALIPALTPPSLNSVGDKLQPEALAAAIRRQAPPHRDYLAVRMPRFRLSEDELRAILHQFVASDLIPPSSPADEPQPSAARIAAQQLAGPRLVSADGFGCTSCHPVGRVAPERTGLNVRGPNLLLLEKRIRPQWFQRWVRNPARIVPRMEMPSVQIPVRGVLDAKLDEQLAAVWRILNTPGFEPPEPNPVRVLRLSGNPTRGERAAVITDLVKLDDQPFLRPFAVGLPNRQNVLFDLESNRLLGWWVGDLARQRTKGKSWFWEAAGKSLLEHSPPQNEVTLMRGGHPLIPLAAPEGICRLQSWRQDAGAAFDCQWQFKNPSAAALEPIKIDLQQTFRPLGKKEFGFGFMREIRLDSVPFDELHWRLVSPTIAKTCTWDQATRTLTLPGEPSRTLVIVSPIAAEYQADGVLKITQGNTGFWSGPAQGSVILQYRLAAPADTVELQAEPLKSEQAVVEIAPGFTGVRLPLPVEMMPTGLSWRPSGPLVFCTLKGQVATAKDTDGDGIEDAACVIADGLAAPYGLLAQPDFVAVGVKPALLHLNWTADETVTQTEIAAAGWGYTQDYHDWTVGPVAAPGGGYYLGLPCQQDNRSTADAHLRGAIVKLTPNRPAAPKARLFATEVFSTGQRFPMGLAVNRGGELFVTDNQGNYNPFNELNHVRRGDYFGFVNDIDKQNPAFQRPALAMTAIQIPHPWTRSLNGICFLDTPQPLRERNPRFFGPLEGHLIGCEYDTRRLIRLTLQKIGDTFQGAAYPLSLPPAAPENGLLGPIVCAVSPRGELYVGGVRDSGWGAGNNVGEIVKITIQPEKLPGGLAEMQVVKTGFTLDFFRPVEREKARHAANYTLTSYRRESTPAYGGPDLDHRAEKIVSITLDDSARRVTLQLGELRTGFVYELRLKNLDPRGQLFHPSEAHYTLNRLPGEPLNSRDARQ